MHFLRKQPPIQALAQEQHGWNGGVFEAAHVHRAVGHAASDALVAAEIGGTLHPRLVEAGVDAGRVAAQCVVAARRVAEARVALRAARAGQARGAAVRNAS